MSAQPVVTGLSYPAMFTVAPDGRIFYSELETGRIRIFDPNTGSHTTYFQIPDLCPGGSLGVALHPAFPQDSRVYVYATRRGADGACHNQVLRIGPAPTGGLEMAVLLSDRFTGGHVGGRLLFGPDGNLYVSTGDGASGLPTAEQERAQRAAVQDTSSVKGKILRMTPAGGVPADNPFGNNVFAYGFRNVFGFDFDPASGRLWATDNGPDPSYPSDAPGPGPNGGCNDEVNLVEKGLNYGWGPTGSCAKPPPAPLNTNQDGPNPVLPKINIEAASGITAARFCTGCRLGPHYEGRLFYVDYDYRDGFGEIHAATLSGDRSTVVSDVLVLRTTGPSPISIERGPDGTLFYSDKYGIYRLLGDSTAAARAAVAVFRPSQGAWYIRGATPDTVFWGTNGDVPVPADYDGDEDDDIAVFRPSQGAWYIRGASPDTVVWGTNGDVPVPMAAT